MLNFLNNPKNNFIAIIATEFICCLFSFTVDYTGAGMESVFIKWIPAIIGFFTLVCFIISRLFLKKFNWIISLIGIAFMILAVLKIQNTDFTTTTFF